MVSLYASLAVEEVMRGADWDPPILAELCSSVHMNIIKGNAGELDLLAIETYTEAKILFSRDWCDCGHS